MKDLVNITVDENGKTKVIYRGTELPVTSVEFEASADSFPTLNCEIVVAPDMCCALKEPKKE